MVHVVPHIDQEASGPSYSVPRLCESLAARGHEVELSCLAAKNGPAGVTLDVHPQWRSFGRFAVSPSHARALSEKADTFDVVHNHSLWSMINVAAGLTVPGKKAKLVTSPRGTLSAWAMSRSRLLKRGLWPFQRSALARADLLHATSEAEYEEIRALKFTAPVAIIPNGIDLPEMPPLRTLHPQRTLLFLSRIHPTKGLDRLLLAWRTLQDLHPEWRLVIAGHGERSYENEIRQLAKELDLKRVEFVGPLFGSSKSEAYFDAELFVLPSHSENFGMVVAEALAHGCPAVVSEGAPWSGLVQERCGWWPNKSVAGLTEALGEAMCLSTETLASMGSSGRTWMERKFSWAKIGEDMEEAYVWATSGGKQPAFTRC